MMQSAVAQATQQAAAKVTSVVVEAALTQVDEQAALNQSGNSPIEEMVRMSRVQGGTGATTGPRRQAPGPRQPQRQQPVAPREPT